MDLNANTDLADLAVLDPARGREPDAQEWIRAKVSLDRIVASRDAAPAPVRLMSRRRRFALVGAAAAVAAAGAVAVR